MVFGATGLMTVFAILAVIIARNPHIPEANPGMFVSVLTQRCGAPSAGMDEDSTPRDRTGIAMIFCTTIFFSFSFGPVSWILAPEVFPTHVRSMGVSVATCAYWVSSRSLP